MADDFYGTTGGLQAYCDARGLVLPGSIDPADIPKALLVASEWIDVSFISQFAGFKVGGRDQLREWPRIGVQDIYGYAVPSNAIPREVENATYEAAVRQLITPGVFFKDYTPGKYKSATVFGAVAVEYAVGDAYSFQTQMPQIAAILYPLLGGSGGNYSGLSGDVRRA